MASVFISHSSKDKEKVRRLAADLATLGHRPWLDEWRIRVGESIVKEIDEGLGESDFVAVVLSRSAAESGWVEREWTAAYGAEIASRQTRVLPLLFEPCEMPQLLRAKKYADFTHSYAVGFHELALALGSTTSAVSPMPLSTPSPTLVERPAARSGRLMPSTGACGVAAIREYTQEPRSVQTLDQALERFVHLLREPAVNFWDVTALSHMRRAEVWSEYWAILIHRLTERTVKLRRLTNVSTPRGVLYALVSSAGAFSGRWGDCLATRTIQLSCGPTSEQLVPALSVFTSQRTGPGFAIVDISSPDVGTSEAAVIGDLPSALALRRVYTEWFRKGTVLTKPLALRMYAEAFGAPTSWGDIDRVLSELDWVGAPTHGLVDEALNVLTDAFSIARPVALSVEPAP